MNAVLFEPLNFNLFQVLVLMLVTAVIGWVAGAAWAGDRREETDLHYQGRDIQDEARRGLIERRRQPRPTAREAAERRQPLVRQPNVSSRPMAREPNREWLR